MEQENSSYLSTLRDLSFITALYLYFIGWIYCYYYLMSFGVGIRQAGIELYSMIIYSTGAFSYYAGSFLFWLCLVVLAAAIFLIRFWAAKKKTSPLPKFVLTLLLLFLFIIIFPLAKKAGTQTAARDQVPGNTTGLSRIYVGFKKDFLTFEPTNLQDSGSYYRKLGLYNLNQAGKLYLLLSSDGGYLAVTLGKPLVIYDLKKEIIDYAYIYKH